MPILYLRLLFAKRQAVAVGVSKGVDARESCESMNCRNVPTFMKERRHGPSQRQSRYRRAGQRR